MPCRTVRSKPYSHSQVDPLALASSSLSTSFPLPFPSTGVVVSLRDGVDGAFCQAGMPRAPLGAKRALAAAVVADTGGPEVVDEDCAPNDPVELASESADLVGGDDEAVGRG